MLVLLGGVGELRRIVDVVALLDDKEVPALGILYDFLPLGPNFLILDLWRASLDSLHEVLLVLPLRQFQRLLNDKVAVVMTDEGEETW